MLAAIPTRPVAPGKPEAAPSLAAGMIAPMIVDVALWRWPDHLGHHDHDGSFVAHFLKRLRREHATR